MISRGLLNQGFLVVKLMSSLRFYGRHRDLIKLYGIFVTTDHEYVPFVAPQSHIPVFSSFITYCPIFNKNNRIGANSVARSLVLYVVLCRSLFVLWFWPWCCLCVFDVSFGIFNLSQRTFYDLYFASTILRYDIGTVLPVWYFFFYLC